MKPNREQILNAMMTLIRAGVLKWARVDGFCGGRVDIDPTKASQAEMEEYTNTLVRTPEYQAAHDVWAASDGIYEAALKFGFDDDFGLALCTDLEGETDDGGVAFYFDNAPKEELKAIVAK